MIFIDSGTMLYHLKAFTEDDYSAWTAIIKAFKASEQRSAQDTVHRVTTRDSTQKRAQLRNSWISNGTTELDQLKQIMSAMDAGFVDIKEQLETIRAQSSEINGPPTSGGSPQRSPQARERQGSVDNSPANSSGSGSSGKFKMKFGIPSLQRSKCLFFLSCERACSSADAHRFLCWHAQLTRISVPLFFLSVATSDGSIASTQSSIENIHARLQASFLKLKSDKEKAFEIMRSEMEKWEKNERQFRMLLSETDNKNASSISLSRTVGDKSTLSRHALEEAYIAHTRTSMTSDRTNSFTSSITGSDIFYDADDAILTADLSSADLSDLEDAGFDDQEDENDFSSDDESAEELAKHKEEAPAPATEQQKAPTAPQATKEAEGPIVRRSVLPAPVSGEDISLLSILRKNVGKDLSTVAMPVSLNEPINVLQRLCEELEYSELLDKAANLEDSLDRLVYVAAFAVSGYATTQWRAARKPFNPLHGETFEYVCPEKGFKFISEKVSHYPPVMAVSCVVF
jgi:hypothetical protein